MKYSCAMPRRSRNASPYHSDEPGRCTAGRWPRRSPLRGLKRGVGFGDAMSYRAALILRPYRLSFFEPQPVGSTVDHHRIAFAELALEHAERERVEHTFLNRAF